MDICNSISVKLSGEAAVAVAISTSDSQQMELRQKFLHNTFNNFNNFFSAQSAYMFNLVSVVVAVFF